MGWLYTDRQPGTSDYDFFAPFMEPFKIIALSNNSQEKAIYMAIQITKGEYEGKVTALVILYDKKQNEYGFKEISEDCGPLYYSCPKRILKLLSPVEELFSEGLYREAARRWRQDCQQGYGTSKGLTPQRQQQFLLF